jgi:V8-like Glu-specific endopeptidase
MIVCHRPDVEDHMSQLRLDPPEVKKLSDLLHDAFSRQRFKEFLFYRLGKNLEDYSGEGAGYQTNLFDVLIESNAKLWWRDLAREARNAVPEDPGLQEFLEKFGYSPQIVSKTQPLRGPQLQLRVKETSTTFNILTWRTRLGEIEGRVCRIEYPDAEAQGTGFLVGPNAVLTNYHVIEPIQKNQINRADVCLRFDYKVGGDGVAVEKGTVYKLASDWLCDSSPASPLDEQVLPHADPNPDELDYAILAVDGTPGDDPVGGATNDPKPTARGWIKVPAPVYDFSKNPALYIVQYPDGKPMQVAIDSQAIVEVTGNETRVRYTTITEPGSSGSPCFGPDWEWIALHHSGDPKYYKGEKPMYNEGIPVAAICALLKQRGKMSILGGGC